MFNARFRLQALTLAILTFWTIVPVDANAGLPVPEFINAAAVKYLLYSSPRGFQISERLLGRTLHPRGQDWAEDLTLLLQRPTMQGTYEELAARFTRVQDEFALEVGTKRAINVFTQADAVLTKAERITLNRLVAERFFDDEFISFLPRGGDLATSAGPLSASRQRFVNSTQARTANLAKLRRLVRSRPKSNSGVAFRIYESLRRDSSAIEKYFPRSDVYALLADDEMLTFEKNFRLVMEALQTQSLRRNARDRIETALSAVLKDQVPARTIRGRIAGLAENPDLDSLRRALGDMTLDETLQMLHGGNPLAPTSGSLLGQYIRKTGAATVVRRFPKGPARGPGATHETGPKRLVVAVSEESFETYRQLFTRENFLVHVHTPQQGTLMLAHRGRAGSYAQLDEKLRFPSEGTILPHIVLKTTEAQRATQYFKLGSRQNLHDEVLEPWKIPGYCATGGYASCTHWVGNIPVGDRLVTEYRFPGFIDEYAHNRIPDTPDPRVQRLRPYQHSSDLTKRVWKVPGNEQLADVIGLGQANLAGELANPGWVAYSLVGSAPLERVPVVFVVVRNHRARIPANFNLRISAH